MKRKSLLTAVAALALGIFGCTSRDSEFKSEDSTVSYSAPTVIELPAGTDSWSEKLGFDDFDGDGTADMVQVVDTALFSEKNVMTFFKGYLDTQGNISFYALESDNRVFPMPVKLEMGSAMFSSSVKWDYADIDGNELADIILSEYDEGFFNDSYKVKAAMNKGDGTFAIARMEGVEDNVGRYISSNLSHGKESIDKFLYLDWGDFNGDGKDDLMIAIDDSNDLRYQIMPSTTAIGSDTVTFGEPITGVVRRFMVDRNCRSLDCEDLDGDGREDLAMVYESIRSLYVGCAINCDGGQAFRPEPDFKLELPKGLSWLTIKTDFLQANEDRTADLGFLTWKDKRPVMVVYHTLKLAR